MNARTQTVFRLYQLFNGIVFTGPIWAVYLLSRGLSLAEFGLVEASLHVGMLAAQIPTGALADAVGRRKLLVAGGFFAAAAELGYVYAPTFGLICLAGAVHGVAFAMRTGSDEAYLFDALAHDDAHEKFPRMLGGMWAVFQFAGAISFLLGGIIATVWSRPAAFWLTAISALIASGIALQLPDDARGKARHSVRVAVDGLRALGRAPRLAALTLAWSMFWASLTSAWYYAAPLFSERGASDALLGFALGAGMLAGAGCSWLGGRIADRVPLTLSVGAVTAGAALGMALGPVAPGLALPVLLITVVGGAAELVYATLSTYLQHNTRSAYRATSMSIAEALFSIQMLWLFPLVGYLCGNRGYEQGYLLCAVVLAVSGALFILSQRLSGLEEPEPATA
jgi:MFS family permease